MMVNKCGLGLNLTLGPLDRTKKFNMYGLIGLVLTQPIAQILKIFNFTS